MPKKKQPEFVDRINNPNNYPYIKNKDGSISTHRMAAEVDEKGNWIVFPTIQFDGKKLVQILHLHRDTLLHLYTYYIHNIHIY